MKIVLTGSTGFAGSEILRQCCQSQQITSIIVLTRKPLKDEMKHSKVNSIVMSDFNTYSPELSDTIADADACIWCLGGTSVEAEIDFPKAFTQAMSKHWSARKAPFRYVHCSGVLAERDQSKSLWFLQEGRRAKGRAETELLDLAQQSERRGLWQTYIMRPSMIMPVQASLVQSVLGIALGSVRVDELARTAIKLAISGNSAATLENNDLAKMGKS